MSTLRTSISILYLNILVVLCDMGEQLKMRKMQTDPDGTLCTPLSIGLGFQMKPSFGLFFWVFYGMALLFLEKVNRQRHKLLARTAA